MMKNIILMCYPRTGSTIIYFMLKHALPKHTDLFEYFNLGVEVIENINTRIPSIINHHDGKMYKKLKTQEDRYNEFLYREELLNRINLPFLMKFFGDFVMRCPHVAERFLKNENNEYIFLDRENRLNSAISYLVGLKTKTWFIPKNGEVPQQQTITFLPEDKLLMVGCLQRMVIFDILKLKLQDKTVMTLKYEDFEKDTKEIETCIRDKFNPDGDVKEAVLQKQNKDHESLISNIDEFKTFVSDFFSSLDNGVPSKELLPEWWNSDINLSKFLK